MEIKRYKINVPEELLIDIKNYFKSSCFSFTSRKTIDQIKCVFPETHERIIREAIKILTKKQGMLIAPGGLGKKGYFLVDVHNKLDREIGYAHFLKLQKHITSTRESAAPFGILKPNDVLSFEEAI